MGQDPQVAAHRVKGNVETRDEELRERVHRRVTVLEREVYAQRDGRASQASQQIVRVQTPEKGSTRPERPTTKPL